MLQRRQDVQLGPMTTFGIPAVGRCLITYDNAADHLPQLFAQGVFAQGDWICLGGGSNTLFGRPYGGTILHCTDSEVIVCECPDDDTVVITAHAGAVMDHVVARACSLGLWGLENLCGIPGHVGGATVQNIGAYGAELKDTVLEVKAFDTTTGRLVTFPAAECRFGYRTSLFKEADGRYIVVSTSFKLHRHAAPRLGYGALRSTVEALGTTIDPILVAHAVCTLRNTKLPDPAHIGSAGSFFKNPVMSREQYARVVDTAVALWGADTEVPHYDLPGGAVKVPAAWFIDRCGWKGRTVGGALVWPQQPLVIVNATGYATAADVITLKDSIIADIHGRFGITLHPEVVIH